jgi:hypothetical protein
LAGLPEIAVVTVVRDEAVMLPRWVKHYSAQCGGPERLVVVDDNTSDGSTDGLPCPVIRLPQRDHPDWAMARLRLVNAMATSLLQAFDAVVFADADEFLVADPKKYADLRELVADRPDAKAIGAIGVNVVHRVGVEPPLDPDRPVLEQRRTGKFIQKMCKPAIKRETGHWASGSHGIRLPYEVDPYLYLFHLKFADRDHLDATSTHRQQLTETEGRGKDANWRFGDELVELLDGIDSTTDLEELPRLKVPADKLRSIVERNDRGVWHSQGRGQVAATRERPLLRIPARFAGTV